MAMRPRFYTISALAVELNLDRRTVAAKLRHVEPTGKVNGHAAWRLADVLPVLNGREPPRPGPRLPPPPGFRALEDVATAFDQGSLVLFLLVIYRIQPLVAWAVTEAGGSMTLAYDAARNAVPMLMIAVEEEMRGTNVPWAARAGVDAPALYEPDAFVPVDWHRLREKAGEPDWTPPSAIPGWRERFEAEV